MYYRSACLITRCIKLNASSLHYSTQQLRQNVGPISSRCGFAVNRSFSSTPNKGEVMGESNWREIIKLLHSRILFISVLFLSMPPETKLDPPQILSKLFPQTSNLDENAVKEEQKKDEEEKKEQQKSWKRMKIG